MFFFFPNRDQESLDNHWKNILNLDISDELVYVLENIRKEDLKKPFCLQKEEWQDQDLLQARICQHSVWCWLWLCRPNNPWCCCSWVSKLFCRWREILQIWKISIFEQLCSVVYIYWYLIHNLLCKHVTLYLNEISKVHGWFDLNKYERMNSW